MKSTIRRLTAAEFKAYYSSHWWQTKRQEALNHYRRQCAVCGDDYKRRTKMGRVWRVLRWLYRLLGAEIKEGNWLEVHHCSYWKNGQPVFHRETMDDLAVLCRRHHPRGPLSRWAIARWRASYQARIWFLAFFKHAPGPR